ncbi:MAG: hypothetical protein CMN56_13930 [Sneathiella sp.]|jgi:hypothetical protein|uniref:hypothetical protein n=1 Tax=Sneathiella sp. TaxID=1964365 RepID=UPI000C63DD94|nr:hypothetical protein [Sneathiella sp.]MAZ04227.1 hypothetical protein [Sneathiella sp.]
MSVISGKAYWASVVAPNTTFDSDGVWSIDVCNLDKKTLASVKKEGLTVKNKGDERGDFVTIKRKVRNQKTGELNRAPTLVDAQKRIMMNTAVGNGSLVNVKYNSYDWEFGGRKGVGANLQAIQVVELVPYSSGDDGEDFEIVSDGFSISDSDEEIPLAS